MYITTYTLLNDKVVSDSLMPNITITSSYHTTSVSDNDDDNGADTSISVEEWNTAT